jgi:hypothetical protein
MARASGACWVRRARTSAEARSARRRRGATRRGAAGSRGVAQHLEQLLLLRRIQLRRPGSLASRARAGRQDSCFPLRASHAMGVSAVFLGARHLLQFSCTRNNKKTLSTDPPRMLQPGRDVSRPGPSGAIQITVGGAGGGIRHRAHLRGTCFASEFRSVRCLTPQRQPSRKHTSRGST